VIVVDASIAVKLILNEPDSATVRQRWHQWAMAAELRLAPPLFRSETLSVVRRSVYRGVLSRDDGDAAAQQLLVLPIQIREPPELYQRAWQLSVRYHRPTVYDCCYLALAEIEQCEFWTADRRLANAVGSPSWLHLP
jgi:predicted nucleic acid-binding protein